MASVKGTLGMKHLAEEAKQEEEKPEEAKSEEEDGEKEKEDPAKEVKQEGEEKLEEESEGSQAAKSEEEDEEKGAEEMDINEEEETGAGKEGGLNKAKKKGAQKIQSSPVTPSASLRPTRERKTVDRFYATSTARASATKPLSIEKGRGVQLKDIPNVAYKLSKRKPDENLQILHSILYGKKTKAHNLKKNIGQFSGYVWVENEHEKQRGRIRDKFDKCVKEKLLDFCDVLNLPVNKSSVKKEELSLRLLEFLESPHATTDLLLADKEKKSKKQKGKATKLKRSIDRTAEKPAKEQKVQVGEKRKLSSEWNEEADNTGDESQEDDESDEDAKEESVQEGIDSEDREQEEAEKSKEEQNEKISSKKDSGTKIRDKVAGKDTPVKSSKSSDKSTKKSSSSALKKDAASADASPKPKVESAKRQKVEKDNGNDKNISAKEKASSRKLSEKDGKPRNVKANSEPSKEEMYAAAVNILKNVDFDTATLSDIIRQLGSHFGVDLMHKKAEVKAIITDVINNMSDDEGEAGDDENED